MSPSVPAPSVPLRINADFSRPAWVLAADHAWVPSPQPGVDRVMLDRVGDEKARATSLVRYASGSVFPVHRHPGGEEIFVLSGVFSAEGVDHPAGCYLRNPPGSKHAPASAPGCLLLVKLWQMSAQETEAVRVDSRDLVRWSGDDRRRRCLLFRGFGEEVSLLELGAGESLFEVIPRSAELLVLHGSLRSALPDGRQHLATGSWLRTAGEEGSRLLASTKADEQGATVFVKVGHLDTLMQGQGRP